jgi:hypothetical protein
LILIEIVLTVATTCLIASLPFDGRGAHAVGPGQRKIIVRAVRRTAQDPIRSWQRPSPNARSERNRILVPV